MTNLYSYAIISPSTGGERESENPPAEEARQKTGFGHAPPPAGDQAHTAALSGGSQEPASPCLPFPGREAPVTHRKPFHRGGGILWQV